jgi:hypothetical protein
MDYGISFVSGAIHKYYDDLQDNKEPVSPLFMESVKVLMVTVMTINFMRSPGLSAFFLVIIAIYWSLGGVDSDFWKACMPMPFLTCLVNYDQFVFLGSFDIIQRLLYVLVVGIGMYIENEFIPEETSLRKTISRIFFVAAFSAAIWIYKDQTSFPFVASASLFLIGYLVSNLIYHATHKKTSPANSLLKEEKNKKSQTTDLSSLDSPQPIVEHSSLSDSDNSPLIKKEVQ